MTGHSLGGALSTLCAFDFAQAESTLVHYSFAAPRSGNPLYAQTFNARVPISFRLANTEDVFPSLPPASLYYFDYQQTNTLIPFTVNLGSIWKNHVNAYIDYLPISYPLKI